MMIGLIVLGMMMQLRGIKKYGGIHGQF